MSKKKIKSTPVNIVPTKPSIHFWERFQTNTFWHLFIIILVPSLIYLKVVNFDFVGFDDRPIIADHFDILSNIKNIGEVFKRDAFLSTDGNSFYRPIQSVSFMLDAMISGVNPWMYHLSNLLIHLLTCVSLYYFLKQLKISGFVAFVFTLFFSVHPLFASAISWVPSRGDLLIALFGLWLFISFHKHILSGKLIYFLLGSVFFMLAVFSKETAVCFPLLLLFYYFFVLNQPFNIKKLTPYFIVWTIALIVYYLLRNYVIKNNLTENVIGINTLLSNLSVIPITISKFFIPYNLSTYPLFDGMATITGILLLGLLLYLTTKYTTKQNTLLLFGILWFFVFTFPGLIVRLPHAEARYLYLEHRTYLIMIGIVILLSSFSNAMLNQKIISLKTFTGIAIAVLITFSTVAWQHSDDYKEPIAFLAKAISFNNPNAYIVRANILLLEHDSVSAANDFDKAVELAPEFPDAYFNRGKFEGAALQASAAENDFTKAISLDSTYTDAWLKRSILRSNLQDYNGALNDLNRAMLLNSNNAEIYFHFGDIFFHQKKYKESYTNLTKAITLLPRYADAYMNRGSLNYVMNNLPAAIEDYKKAIAIKPVFLSYYNLAVVYNDLQQPDKAIPLFDSSLTLSPNFSAAYMGKGIAFKQQKNMANACENWQQALNLGNITAKDTLNKYCK